ncbi:hypothetical protein BLNAU_14015 [Blattamonas nauphoetae]|uniref:Uncharacterized protein n=1 Tax=Blattamonas nauphoetae TaxID=2049346 RepID=A0ABQ9XJQ9_9EUKA|nr:hypothetical protein BLNAU_14015 [Blattamonas nauphoetae]
MIINLCIERNLNVELHVCFLTQVTGSTSQVSVRWEKFALVHHVAFPHSSQGTDIISPPLVINGDVEGSYQHVRVKQLFRIASFPPRYSHPLQLALLHILNSGNSPVWLTIEFICVGLVSNNEWERSAHPFRNQTRSSSSPADDPPLFDQVEWMDMNCVRIFTPQPSYTSLNGPHKSSSVHLTTTTTASDAIVMNGPLDLTINSVFETLPNPSLLTTEHAIIFIDRVCSKLSKDCGSDHSVQFKAEILIEDGARSIVVDTDNRVGLFEPAEKPHSSTEPRIRVVDTTVSLLSRTALIGELTDFVRRVIKYLKVSAETRQTGRDEALLSPSRMRREMTQKFAAQEKLEAEKPVLFERRFEMDRFGTFICECEESRTDPSTPMQDDQTHASSVLSRKWWEWNDDWIRITSTRGILNDESVCVLRLKSEIESSRVPLDPLSLRTPNSLLQFEAVLSDGASFVADVDKTSLQRGKPSLLRLRREGDNTTDSENGVGEEWDGQLVESLTQNCQLLNEVSCEAHVSRAEYSERERRRLEEKRREEQTRREAEEELERTKTLLWIHQLRSQIK